MILRRCLFSRGTRANPIFCKVICNYFVLLMIIIMIHNFVIVVVCTSTNNEDNNEKTTTTTKTTTIGEGEQDFDIILIKIGGSSITNKAIKETIDQESLNWFAEIISKSISDEFQSSEESSTAASSSFSVVGDEGLRNNNNNNNNNNRRRRHRENPTLSFVVKVRGPAPLFGTSDAFNVINNKEYDIQIGQTTEEEEEDGDSSDDETASSSSSSSKSNEGRQEESSSSSHDDARSHHHRRPLAYVVVHGAGSFGHFTAKEYGLKGQTTEPMNNNNTTTSTTNDSNHLHYSDDDSFMMEEQEHYRRQQQQQQQNKGLSETRISVQKLNQIVVREFLNHNINAVGISPCFGIPGIEAHLTLQPRPIIAMLEDVVKRTIKSRLVPILHGDACLYGSDGGVGILSGDHIVEVLGKSSWIKNVVFITDVDGVYDVDPSTIIKNNNPTTTTTTNDDDDDDPKLLRNIFVNKTTGILHTKLNASGSTHKHDVTGGLQTKLKSAASIVTTGKNVTIVKVRSLSAEQAIAQEDVIETGSIISCID